MLSLMEAERAKRRARGFECDIPAFNEFDDETIQGLVTLIGAEPEKIQKLIEGLAVIIIELRDEPKNRSDKKKRDVLLCKLSRVADLARELEELAFQTHEEIEDANRKGVDELGGRRMLTDLSGLLSHTAAISRMATNIGKATDRLKADNGPISKGRPKDNHLPAVIRRLADVYYDVTGRRPGRINRPGTINSADSDDSVFVEFCRRCCIKMGFKAGRLTGIVQKVAADWQPL